MGRRAAAAAGRSNGLLLLLLLLLWPMRSAQARPPVPSAALPFAELELPTPGRVELSTQDSEGALWAAMREGLYRFDGRHFEFIPSEPGACADSVRRLVAGPAGAIWCLGGDALARWRQGHWQQVELPPRPGWPGQDLVLDAQGGAWVLTSQGLFHVPEGQARAEPVAGWSGKMPRALWVGGAGALYVTDLGALHRREVDGQWRGWGPGEGLPPEQLVGVAEDGEGRVWAWSAKETWVLRPGAPAFVPGPYLGNDLLGVAAALDAHGRLWWAGPHGLFRQEGEAVSPVQGVPPGWLSHVFIDREGTVWVSGGAGLFRMLGRGLWRNHGKSPGPLAAEAPWALQRDDEGQLWAGTSRGLWKATAAGWERIPALKDRGVRFILPGPEGVLWLAVEREVWRYEPRTGTVLRVGPQQGLADGIVQALAWDAPSTLWVGTSAGLFRGIPDGQGLRLSRVELQSQEERTPISDLVREGPGRLWAASVNGLFRVEDSAVRRFTAEDGLRSTWVRFLALRQSGELCVSYENAQGLSCFHPQGLQLPPLRHLDRSAGLRNGTVEFLGDDAHGRLWVGGERGVDVVARDSDAIVASHTVADGLPGDDCAPRSFLAEPEGTVWVGTRAGLGQFMGAEELQPAPPPSTLLSLLDATGGRLPTAPGLVVPAEVGPVEVEVTALTLAGQHRVEHQWRLGAGEDFRPGSGGSLRLAGLAPGSHVLEVRSRLRHGEWGPVASLAFTVAAPWWRSPWAAFSGLVLLALAGTLGFRLRQQVLQRRNAELEALVSQRTAELERTQQRVLALEKATLERRMAGGFAHEMRNALHGAKLLIGRAIRGAQGTSLPEETSDKLMALYQQVRGELPPELHASVALLLRQANGHQEELFSVLQAVDSALGRGLAITRQILDYAQLGREQPGQERVSLRPLVQAVLDESREGLRGVELRLEVPEDCAWVGRPTHFSSILTNLVLNARDALNERPAGAERRLAVEVQPREHGCLLRVEDTGAGIAPEHRAQLFEPFFSTKPDQGRGLGLAMVARLVALYGGQVDVASEPGRGSTFSVWLPSWREPPG